MGKNKRQVAALHRRKLVALQAFLLTIVLAIALVVPAAWAEQGDWTLNRLVLADGDGIFFDTDVDDDWGHLGGADIRIPDEEDGTVLHISCSEDLTGIEVLGRTITEFWLSSTNPGGQPGQGEFCTEDFPNGDDPEDATIIVEKIVEGDGDAPEDDFVFELVCNEVTIDDDIQLGHEDTDTFTDEDGFTDCTVEEIVHHDADSTSWAITGDVTDSGDGLVTDSFDVDPGETVTVTFTNTFDPDDPPGTATSSVDVEFVKVWFDADGEETDGPSSGWAVTITEHADDDTLRATLQGTTTSAERSFVEGRDYTVAEDELPAGWDEVGCGDVNLTSVDAGDIVATGTGTESADADGVHVVCNQAEVEVLAEVLEEEVEVLDELPRTGLPTTLLSLFGLLGIALGGGLLGRSRS